MRLHGYAVVYLSTMGVDLLVGVFDLTNKGAILSQQVRISYLLPTHKQLHLLLRAVINLR